MGAGRVAARTGRARLAVFIIGALATFLLAARRNDTASAITAVATVVLFALLVAHHRRITAEVRMSDALAHACDAGAARVRRDWPNIPSAPAPDVSPSHPYANDLNIFGDVSLARLLGPVSAVAGRPILHQWLLAETPPPIEVLGERQRAIAELASDADWRERLGMLAARAGHSAESFQSFLAWSESSETLIGTGRSWIARVLAVVTVGALALAFVRPEAVGLIMAMVIVNVAFTASQRANLRRGVEAASARGFSLEHVARMFDHARSRLLDAPSSALLRDLRARMEPRDVDAFARLARIAHWGELRHSPMAYAVFQVVVLWDFHVVYALDRWRARYGHSIRDWVAALGELEACAALAALAHDNPAWVYPEIVETGLTSIESTQLAHPLLSAVTRVANDVVVGPRDTFLLITGSNMAGKSTLLRSIGLNAVLAQLGAPVCATSFRLPAVRVRTSIQVRDALEQGLSLFMSEVLRLKSIVDDAGADGPMLLYLADEMLHGTNTEERRIAVVAVISHLLRAGAIGAVATHDVELSSDPALAGHARPIYFVEQFRDTARGPEMWFDYRLRPGLATSRNALKLIELVGLTAR